MRLITKIQASRLTNNAINEQNSEVASINEPQYLNVRPIVGGPKCPTGKLYIKTFLKTYKKLY